MVQQKVCIFIILQFTLPIIINASITYQDPSAPLGSVNFNMMNISGQELPNLNSGWVYIHAVSVYLGQTERKLI